MTCADRARSLPRQVGHDLQVSQRWPVMTVRGQAGRRPRSSSREMTSVRERGLGRVRRRSGRTPISVVSASHRVEEQWYQCLPASLSENIRMSNDFSLQSHWVNAVNCEFYSSWNIAWIPYAPDPNVFVLHTTNPIRIAIKLWLSHRAITRHYDRGRIISDNLRAWRATLADARAILPLSDCQRACGIRAGGMDYLWRSKSVPTATGYTWKVQLLALILPSFWRPLSLSIVCLLCIIPERIFQPHIHEIRKLW